MKLFRKGHRKFAANNDLFGDNLPGVFKYLTVEYEITQSDGVKKQYSKFVEEFGESFEILPNVKEVDIEYIPKTDDIVKLHKAVWKSNKRSLDVCDKLIKYYRNQKREFWGSNK